MSKSLLWDPEETGIEKRCWIGVTGTWCKTWLWLGNAKVKCLDTVTLNSPCVIVVSPEFPILVQFLITKPLGRFSWACHGVCTQRIRIRSIATWLFTPSLPHPLEAHLPSLPAKVFSLGQWDKAYYPFGPTRHATMPLEIYLRDVWLSAQNWTLISTSQYSHLPWLPKQWNVVGWTETFLDFFHINDLRISVSWEHSEETATLGGAPWSRQLKRHRSIALSGWLVGLGSKWSSLSVFSMLWAFGCKKSMYLYTIVKGGLIVHWFIPCVFSWIILDSCLKDVWILKEQ